MEIIQPNLTSYQKAILFSKARFTITEASTKVGKTYSHIIWIFGKSMESQPKDGANYWWVAPVYNQAKIAFKRLRSYLAPTGLFFFNETELRIDTPIGSHIYFKSAEKPDNLYGEDVYAAVFDEAPRAREDAWFALRSTLTATNAPCKLIGNFGGSANWMHQLKVKSSNDENYEYFKITCYDAVDEGILSKDEIEQAQKDLPVKIFKELYLAEPSEDEGRLIKNEAIKDLWTNDFVKGDNKKYISCDVARFGNDKAVIIVWNGLIIEQILSFDNSSITELAAIVKNTARTNKVPNSRIVIDDDGVGGGLTDIIGGVGFVNNSAPIKNDTIKENFNNLKSQCYFKLADKINNGEVFISVDNNKYEIIEELQTVIVKGLDRDNKLSVLSKDDVKKIIGRSPDFSDAIMMRMYFELSSFTTKF